MTVGEKMQFYRKKIGLSQEQLGQQMLVSRQTVSLWESDKTMPTVDNLVRLKEIFSISIDEILSEDEPVGQGESREGYSFRYDETDLREIFKKTHFSLMKRAIIFLLASAVLFAFSEATETDGIIMGLLIGFILTVAISQFKGYRSYRKSWKNAQSRILQNEYSYTIYENYFVLKISRNGEITTTQTIFFDDIEKIRIFGNLLVLQASGQSYLLKKDQLPSDSAIIDFCGRAPDRVKKNRPGDKLKTISILLFVLSICTIWGALIGVAILSNANQAMTENMWVFFLFLPVPIASVVFGFYLKKKGYKYLKNIIVGVIMAVLLCIYGSFTFLFADVYSHSDEPISRIEQMLEIDVPAHLHINTQDWTKGTQSIPRGYIYSTSDIYFDDTAVEEFERNLLSDTKWISAIPNDMVGVSSYFCDIQPADYYIIYNISTNEFNKLPGESGTYEFINVLYYVESNTMKLVEYQVNYSG